MIDLDDVEESSEWSNYLSTELPEAIARQVRETNFALNLPIVYMNTDGWLVKEYKDGRVEKIKKIK